jgi:pilus assembly protein Flp/PilA
MKRIFDRIKTFARDEEGASMVEYGLMVALIAVVCILVVKALGTGVSKAFDEAQSQVNTNAPATPTTPK